MAAPLLPSHKAIGSRITRKNEVLPESGVGGGGPLLTELGMDWLPPAGKSSQVSGVFLVLMGEAGRGKWRRNHTRNSWRKGKNY